MTLRSLDTIAKDFPIVSEECEPFAARMIGVMWARCQSAKNEGDTDVYIDGLRHLWMMTQCLSRIAILASTATHFSIAINNHMGMISQFVLKEVGIDPYQDPTFKWE